MNLSKQSPSVMTLISLPMIVGAGSGNAQPAQPSFDCAKARTQDERLICDNVRLSKLDQAVSIAYSQVDSKYKHEAAAAARKSLVARRQCGADPLCILDQQVSALNTYADLGSKVPVPPWVGVYRIKLSSATPTRFVNGLPLHIGQCTRTKIASISTRFGEELKPPMGDPDSGTAISFANQGYQVSYEYIPAIAESRIGDDVLLCLVSLPQECPPGDERGRVYSGTNLRTSGSWILPDAQHMCGGA